MKSLSTKIGFLIVIFIASTIVFMFIFTDFLYEQLYVQDSEQAMIEIGTKLQSSYRGGIVTDEFVQDVEQFNLYSNYHVFAVRNPKELSACVPFEIDYDTLIGPEERKKLLKGNSITKIGYEKRFDRQIVSVVIPLVDQNRLEGIIYLYYPLAKITEMANAEVVILLIGAFIFVLCASFFVFKMLRRIMRPLNNLKTAVEKMSDGDYGTRVEVISNDEVGQLSNAFNTMAQSIQEEDEAKKTFLATVSHELRTPISYVKGYSESITNGLIQGEKKEEAILLIAREANRMERLTNELMQLVHADLETNQDFVPIVLAETIRESIQLLALPAKQKNISIVTDLDEAIIINGDEEKLKQIFINLIENAIRYSHTGQNVTVKLSEIKGKAVVQVSDKGIGISEENLTKVTERFYRVNKARSRSDGGSGLGLSIVDMLTKLHGGQLTIHSTLGEGTTVEIELPLMEE